MASGGKYTTTVPSKIRRSSRPINGSFAPIAKPERPSTISRVSETEKPVASFESGLTELESVVKQLESGDLPLEQALALFEKGMQLSESCRKQLEEAETKIEILIRKNDKIQAEPFKPGKA
jgi:exodeoxyribonuclease VII small subunit